MAKMGRPPGPTKDRYGNIVPEGKCREAWDARPLFVEFYDKIFEVKTLVQKIAMTKAGVFSRCSQAVVDLDNARRAVLHGKPYAMCPRCKGRGCQPCRGMGWLPKAHLQALNAERAKK